MPSSSHFTRKGTGHPTNQDAYRVRTTGVIHLYLVCDGHGDLGHVASNFIANEIERTLLGYILAKTKTLSDEAAVKLAISEAFRNYDEALKREGESGLSSGTTAAGILYDTRDGSVVMFSVGDSLLVAQNQAVGSTIIMPLQNANNITPDDAEKIQKAQWKTGFALTGTSEGGTSYMMIPGVQEGGLQLYSVFGDHEAKSANPAVGLLPVIKTFRVTRGSKFLVASDGAYDGVFEKLSDRGAAEFIEKIMQSPSATAAAMRTHTDDDLTILMINL